MMDCFEKNKGNISKRMEAGLNLLREHYEVREVPVADYFGELNIQGNVYHVTHYEVVGVGNLLVMVEPDGAQLQMDSFVLMPYYKNLPLFTTDYMYMGERRGFLNEIYDLVDPERKTELYQSFIAKFAANKEKYSYLPDMPLKACWYDAIRPVCTAKAPTSEHDEEIITLFLENLRTFIEMEQAMPLITDEEEYQAKWRQNKAYSDGLVDNGGVSTDVFKATLGADKTKEFFDEVFFAPARFRK